jgi:hypothetical protein
MEIWFWQVDGHWYLASDTTPRAWFANLRANPRFTFHLKHGVKADLPATAAVITDEPTRRRILHEIIRQDGRQDPAVLDSWVDASPLVQILFDAT